MDGEKDHSGHELSPNTTLGENTLDVAQSSSNTGAPRIQFIPTEKPAKSDRGRAVAGKEDASVVVDSITRRRSRSLSVASIPRVISEKEKDRFKSEKEAEKKNVNIDEHLQTHQVVAQRYQTKINLEKPEESFGLTSQQAEQLLQEHGPNILTPVKKRHPFLKYLDCLRSLFNLLLILAGVLEYLLLGINFKSNIQNVSCSAISFLDEWPAVWRSTC
jgi:sodium/potassium-transporting ATPase subunit alpha